MKATCSKHGMERMIERLGCKPCKCQKLTEKAYRSTEPIPDTTEYNKQFKESNATYRYFMGFVWVFQGKKLITLFFPNKHNHTSFVWNPRVPVLIKKNANYQ